jgi:4,5-DOPA dioxygenase extradiol
MSLASDITPDNDWGLDHGAWTLLVHLYPEADIPVILLSVDNSKPSEYYYDLGQKLRPLRDQGIVLIGSGSIVHNLRNLRWGGPAHTWATSFNNWVKEQVESKNDSSLLHYIVAPGGKMSVPTPDHYYPFIFTLGSSYVDESRTTLIDWIDNGANGMTSFSFGLA